MSSSIVFNSTVCIIGIVIFLIHVVNLVIKKNKRKDEMTLLYFFVLTIVHFFAYLCFTIIKLNYTSNAFIIAFYTAFYIMNNLQVLLFFLYTQRYLFVQPGVSKKLTIFNYLSFSAFVILDVINIFTGIFFTAKDGEYTRSPAMILSQGYQFIILLTVFSVIISNDKLLKREKTAFGFYCFLPLVAILLQNIFKGYAIAYASIIISIEILILFINVQKNIVIAEEKEKNKEVQIKMMLSQIQPHFIFNSLSSISTLIEIDPEKAQAALDDFTEFLRCNISSLSDINLIPFEDELRHIEAYVKLEKMRFGERVNAVYDIQTTSFYVPPLSIQPIVENAIKHGILKKLQGGNVIIRTYEKDSLYVVEVEDSGVGFCVEDLDLDNNMHIGISNIKYRVENSCNGKLKIESETEKGTKVEIIFPKEVRV